MNRNEVTYWLQLQSLTSFDDGDDDVDCVWDSKRSVNVNNDNSNTSFLTSF